MTVAAPYWYCSNCASVVASWIDGRLKVSVRSRLLIVHKSGEVKIRCHHCRKDTALPLVVDQGLTGDIPP